MVYPKSIISIIMNVQGMWMDCESRVLIRLRLFRSIYAYDKNQPKLRALSVSIHFIIYKLFPYHRPEWIVLFSLLLLQPVKSRSILFEQIFLYFPLSLSLLLYLTCSCILYITIRICEMCLYILYYLQEILLLTSLRKSPHITCTIYKPISLNRWYYKNQSGTSQQNC